jgi:flagellar hook-length control protein FliK
MIKGTSAEIINSKKELYKKNKSNKKEDDNFEDQMKLTQVASLLDNNNFLSSDVKNNNEDEGKKLSVIKKTLGETTPLDNQTNSKLDGFKNFLDPKLLKTNQEEEDAPELIEFSLDSEKIVNEKESLKDKESNLSNEINKKDNIINFNKKLSNSDVHDVFENKLDHVLEGRSKSKLDTFQIDQNEAVPESVSFSEENEVIIKKENKDASEISLDSDSFIHFNPSLKEKNNKKSDFDNSLKKDFIFNQAQNSFNDVSENNNIISFEKNLSENFLENINKKIKSILDIQGMNKLKEIKILSEFKIRMKPDHLGEIHIKLTSKDNKVYLQIQSDNEKLKEILEGSVDKLKENLLKQDFLLSKMDVEVLKNQDLDPVSQKKEIDHSFYNESNNNFSNSENFGENSQKSRNQYEKNENSEFFEDKEKKNNEKSIFKTVKRSLNTNQSIDFLI